MKSRNTREFLLKNFCEACNRLDRIVGIIQFVVKIGWDVEVRVGNRIINYSRLNRERLRPLLLRPVFMKHPIWNSKRMTVRPIDGSLVEVLSDCNTGNCIQRPSRICCGRDDVVTTIDAIVHFLMYFILSLNGYLFVIRSLILQVRQWVPRSRKVVLHRGSSWSPRSLSPTSLLKRTKVINCSSSCSFTRTCL